MGEYDAKRAAEATIAVEPTDKGRADVVLLDDVDDFMLIATDEHLAEAAMLAECARSMVERRLREAHAAGIAEGLRRAVEVAEGTLPCFDPGDRSSLCAAIIVLRRVADAAGRGGAE